MKKQLKLWLGATGLFIMMAVAPTGASASTLSELGDGTDIWTECTNGDFTLINVANWPEGTSIRGEGFNLSSTVTAYGVQFRATYDFTLVTTALGEALPQSRVDVSADCWAAAGPYEQPPLEDTTPASVTPEPQRTVALHGPRAV